MLDPKVVLIPDQAEWKVELMGSRILLVAALAIAAFAVDQTTKWLILNVIMSPPRVIEITPFFNLTLGFNTGVSFGMFREFFEHWPGVLTVFKLLVASGLIIWALRTTLETERIGLSMIAGGALGNALDRHRQGAVTDFLDFHYRGWHWPTFNMADVVIVCGAALLIASGILWSRSSSVATPQR